MNTTLPGRVPQPPGPPPLDEVMLAMDVVDTLRHQQDLVDHALSENAREAALVARIRAIYAGQGIEVSDAIIVEGVEALKKDRFLYQPPPRSLSVRLAHLYVDRARMRRWLIGLVALALVGWLVADVWSDVRSGWTRFSQRGVIGAAREQVTGMRERVAALAHRLQLAQRDHAAARVPSPTGEAGQRLHDLAGAELATTATTLERAQAAVAGVELPQNTDDAARVEAVLAPLAPSIEQAGDTLTQAQERLETLAQLDLAATRLAQAQASLADAQLDADAAAEVRTLARQALQALGAADAAAARAAVERLSNLARTVELAYELRIVSRPGVQSGVWRHPVDNAGARNYYIIVEAIGADGRPVELPVTSEEDQTTRQVSTFGVRVPEAVYERVRADKQDNGLIDDAVFGHKRRGELAPSYRHAVSGGAITSW